MSVEAHESSRYRKELGSAISREHYSSMTMDLNPNDSIFSSLEIWTFSAPSKARELSAMFAGVQFGSDIATRYCGRVFTNNTVKSVGGK